MRARVKPAVGERPDYDIERDIVAAHDDEIGRADVVADHRHVGRRYRHRARRRAHRSPETRRPARTPSPRPNLCWSETRSGRRRRRPSETNTNSSRPSSEAIRTGTRAVDGFAQPRRTSRASADQRRDEIVKVNIAEVGNPGSTISGLSPIAASNSGLPGFSATPCTRMPGLPSRDTMRCDRSPAPFDVPPESTTMSQDCSGGAHRRFERDLVVRKGAECAPARRRLRSTAAAMIAPLLS